MSLVSGVVPLGPRHDDGDAGERLAAVLIGHPPGHPPGRLLRPGPACAGSSCQSQGRCTNSNPGHRSSLSVRQGCQTVGGASHIALVVKEVEATDPSNSPAASGAVASMAIVMFELAGQGSFGVMPG